MARIQQKNIILTLEERNARIEGLLKYNRIALEGMTVAELRELGAYLIPDARKLKKPEFINSLLEIIETYRKEYEKQNQLETLAIAKLFEEKVESLGSNHFDYDMIRKACVNKIDQMLFSKKLAEVMRGAVNYGSLKPSTVVTDKRKQLKVFLDKLSLENPEYIEWAQKVYSQFLIDTNDYSITKNKEYKEKVNDYGSGDNTTILNGNKILNWASDVIDWAFQQENLDKGWHKVSVALSLTSGRRMDEIHGHCQFEAVNEKTLRSIGLSKKKDDDEELTSPCLVDANKWVAVINKFPSNRRNQNNTVVNGTIRPAIKDSGVYQVLFDVYDFHMIATEDKETRDNPIKKGDKILPTYKDCRDFYISYLITSEYEPNRKKYGISQTGYIRKIIGHESKKQSQSYEKILVTLD